MTASDPLVHPATADRWDDVMKVMGVKGDPAYCWCQYFRQTPQERRQANAATNRDALQIQVRDEDPAPGVLAYIDEEPVGWCAVGPKQTYPRVLSSRVAGPDVDGIWSIVCFVVRVGWRRRGVGAALLQGVVDLARSQGATTVEGYPVDPSERRSVSSSDLYHGTLSLFLDAGFEEVSRSSPSRALVSLKI
ncbi:MAG: GNAT family N-acetyltransferase [Acidimicrobiia bacterium]|nr:GNAT family N-acetyltransferase [Acidimicrobiia bacterium]